MPLALLALASSLDPARYEPVIIDGRWEEDPIKAVLEQCPGALCVGCTVLSGTPIGDARRVSRAVRETHPVLPVIWGGWHPSIFPEGCLQEPAVDISVQGQGEPVLRELVAHLSDGTTPVGCPGCAVRDSHGQTVFSPSRPLEDPGSFPAHDFGLLDVERYFRLKGRRQIDYVSSQGCCFRCRFCADPAVYRRQWKGLDPQRVGNDLEILWHRWRFHDVSFQDETFFTSRSRVEGIATQLQERGIVCTWAATLRADQGARMPKELSKLCARSGLRKVIIGVESATPEGLLRLQKDITLDQVWQSAELCARFGISATFPFIVGLPGEPLSHVDAALDMAAKLRSMSPGFETPFFFYQPYPGTELGAEMEAAGYRLPTDLGQWEKFDFVGTAGPWVPEETRRRVAPHILPRPKNLKGVLP